MKAEYIQPFLESARMVMEQMMQIRPSTGQLTLKDVIFREQDVWIQIGISGQMNGDVIFGLKKEVAIRIISAMMGGFAVTEIDEMGRSAISELGNMISGNASTIFYNRGVKVDITPPRVVDVSEGNRLYARKALTVPLILEGIGEMELQVLIA